MEEILSLPIVKKLGLRQEKIQEVIKEIRKHNAVTITGEELGTVKSEVEANEKELFEVFQRIVKIAWGQEKSRQQSLTSPYGISA